MAYRLRHRHRHPRRHSRRSTMMWRSIPTTWWYAAVAMPTIQRSIPIIWWCPAVGPWRPTTTMRVYIKRTREWEAMHHPQSKATSRHHKQHTATATSRSGVCPVTQSKCTDSQSIIVLSLASLCLSLSHTCCVVTLLLLLLLHQFFCFLPMVCKVKLVLSFTIHVLQTKNVCTKLQNSTQKQKQKTKPKSIYNSLCSWSMLSLSFRFILYITANTSNIISGHLSCATNPHPSSPKTSLSGCNIRTVFCIFIPPAESTVFLCSSPLLTHLPRPEDRRTEGQMDKVHSTNRYSNSRHSQSKIPTKLSTQCALHSILM